MPDLAVTVIGLAVTRLGEFFSPEAAVPPLGGGTEVVNVVAGEIVTPPEWVGTGSDDCTGCGPWLWIRLARRWRTEEFPIEAVTGSCGLHKAITIEAGIARCHPLTNDPTESQELAAVQWDDSWRLDLALCAAMQDAEREGIAINTGLGAGEVYGPDGLVIASLQTAHAQLRKGL